MTPELKKLNRKMKREYWILYLVDSPFNKEPKSFILSSPVAQLMEEEGQRFEGSYRPMEDKVG